MAVTTTNGRARGQDDLGLTTAVRCDCGASGKVAVNVHAHFTTIWPSTITCARKRHRPAPHHPAISPVPVNRQDDRGQDDLRPTTASRHNCGGMALFRATPIAPSYPSASAFLPDFAITGPSGCARDTAGVMWRAAALTSLAQSICSRHWAKSMTSASFS